MDLDLRKFHINNEKELIAFLELVEARVPEIIRTVKKMQMQNASLENVVANERKKRAEAAQGIIVNNNVPANSTPEGSEQEESIANAEAVRLAQMRQASEQATKVFGTHPKSVKPGDIGQVVAAMKEENAKAEQADITTTVDEPVEEKPKRRLGLKRKK